MIIFLLQVVSVKVFKQAIPQPEIGFENLMSQVEAAVAQVPGLHIVGNYKSGVSVGDCVAGGMAMAAQVKQQSVPEAHPTVYHQRPPMNNEL